MRLRNALLVAVCALCPLLIWTVASAQLNDAVQTAAQNTQSESPLKTIDWLVGQWSAQQAGDTVNFTCHFTKNDAFLIRSFTSSSTSNALTSGMQIIAWDPGKSAVRSWTYDSRGGFGEDTWIQNGNRYTLRSIYTFADGGKASMLNVATFIDNDHFSWKSVQRVIDGELQPDVEEIVFARTLTIEKKEGEQ